MLLLCTHLLLSSSPLLSTLALLQCHSCFLCFHCFVSYHSRRPRSLLQAWSVCSSPFVAQLRCTHQYVFQCSWMNCLCVPKDKTIQQHSLTLLISVFGIVLAFRVHSNVPPLFHGNPPNSSSGVPCWIVAVAGSSRCCCKHCFCEHFRALRVRSDVSQLARGRCTKLSVSTKTTRKHVYRLQNSLSLAMS